MLKHKFNIKIGKMNNKKSQHKTSGPKKKRKPSVRRNTTIENQVLQSKLCLTLFLTKLFKNFKINVNYMLKVQPFSFFKRSDNFLIN